MFKCSNAHAACTADHQMLQTRGGIQGNAYVSESPPYFIEINRNEVLTLKLLAGTRLKMVGGKDWRNHKVADHHVQCIIQTDRMGYRHRICPNFPLFIFRCTVWTIFLAEF